MTRTYQEVHDRLRAVFGWAKDHTCSCGEQAKDWAYLRNGDPELYNSNGFPYSEDLSCYTPMCRSCHLKFDWPYRSDRSKEASRENAVLARAALKIAPPEVHARRLAGLVKARQVPISDERRQTLSQSVSQTNRRKRRCLSCGKISNPAGIGKHQIGSGHYGYEDVT